MFVFLRFQEKLLSIGRKGPHGAEQKIIIDSSVFVEMEFIVCTLVGVEHLCVCEFPQRGKGKKEEFKYTTLKYIFHE